MCCHVSHVRAAIREAVKLHGDALEVFYHAAVIVDCPLAVPQSAIFLQGTRVFTFKLARITSHFKIKLHIVWYIWLTNDLNLISLFFSHFIFQEEKCNGRWNVHAYMGANITTYVPFNVLFPTSVQASGGTVLHRHNLVAKNTSSYLHKSLRVAVRDMNKIKAPCATWPNPETAV